MNGLATFLDSLLHGVDLVALALCTGSALWGLLLLKPWQTHSGFDARFFRSGIHLFMLSAFALALVQSLVLATKVWLITETLGRFPFPAFLHTFQFQAGILRILCALALGFTICRFLVRDAASVRGWFAVAVLLLPLVISGAWLVHGASRLEYRFLLMTGTVIHQIGAGIWVGGIAQLIAVWIQTRKAPELQADWVILLTRFSLLGIASVVLLSVTGIVMAWFYIGSLQGLFGTGYGNLLMVKLGLFAIALCFAGLNFTIARRCLANGDRAGCMRRIPHFIESEAFVLVAVLFTAGALSSQPPSIDIPQLTASAAEVADVLRPKMPRLTSPSHQDLMAGEASRTAVVNQTPSSAAAAWSDYNHNVAGLFLLVMTVFGMLSYLQPFAWARYWPLGFVGLAVFLFFRADAEAWPMGPLGFWESLAGNVEILQHRLATLLTFALGVFEFRARRCTSRQSWQPYAFPVLCALGGLILMTHSHLGFQPKTEFLIQIGHTLIGLFAIVAACGRWLELKLQAPYSRIAGFTSVLAIFMISLVLLFYREPLQ